MRTVIGRTAPGIALLAAAAIGPAALPPAGAAAPPVDALVRHVAYLTSDALEGRRTGSEGARRAAAYLAGELERLGAVPPSGAAGFELPFEFTAGTADEGSSLTLRGGGEWSWTGGGAVQALFFSDSGTISGPLVFAGYGIVAPDGAELPYDSYAYLDVTDKVVLVLRHLPEALEPERRAELARYAGLRYKALQARERGAKGLLVVTGPRSPNAGETVGMSFDSAVAGSGIVAASLSGEVGEAIFRQVPGRTLGEAQLALDGGDPKAAGFDLPGVEVTLTVKLRRERQIGRNVVGVLRGTGPDADKPFVVVGSHFDHLGKGRSGSSLARGPEADGIHYGADDNASGVAAVLALAEILAAGPHRRDVVLAFWSGEELGVLGSTDFLERGPIPAERIAAYVNFDMVGRMREGRLSVQATGSSVFWPEAVERANAPVGLALQLQEDPYLPTDSSSFNRVGVPTLNFFTGGHEDYHRPTDVAGKLNYGDLERVARLGAAVVAELAERETAPVFVRVDPKVAPGGGRDAVRAFTGTIPDYSTEVAGLLLAGVTGGGPAAEAGLRAGDVLVEFAGQTIANVYDYTYALDGVKIDRPVSVVFLRDGERRETTLTPRARR